MHVEGLMLIEWEGTGAGNPNPRKQGVANPAPFRALRGPQPGGDQALWEGKTEKLGTQKNEQWRAGSSWMCGGGNKGPIPTTAANAG